MRLEDINNVLILSCVLFSFYVNSQTSCPVGWFGPTCKYKCRCILNSCDADGNCTGFYPCVNGWFGPACQYADLAYDRINEKLMGDANDVTCLSGNVSYVKISTNDAFDFTWLRLKVSELGSAFLKDVSLSFFINKAPVICSSIRKQFVDSTTLDLHCDLQEFINEVILEGKAASYACSAYISGGRNLAVKENTTQTSTYTEYVDSKNRDIDFTSDLAVDGKRVQNFYDGLSCTHTSPGQSNTDPLPTWTLTLSKQRPVSRYLIYNRLESPVNYRLQGFKLESFNASNHKMFMYRDTNPSPQLNYSVVHKPMPVGKVAISVNNSELLLTLCEVEVYGDSICDATHFGRDCELNCQCAYGEPCIVATGGCFEPCPAGFHGLDCLSPCSSGFFGDGCRSNCSSNCASVIDGLEDTHGSPCNHVTGACAKGCNSGFIGLACERECPNGNCALACSSTCMSSDNASQPTCNLTTGACLMGCTSGFTGMTCETGCGVGKYGSNCGFSCSENCAATVSEFVSTCNPETGACVKGCKTSFAGETCDIVSAQSDSSSGVNSVVIVGACLTLAAAGFLGYCCTRKKAPPIEENTGAPPPPPPLPLVNKPSTEKRSSHKPKHQERRLTLEKLP